MSSGYRKIASKDLTQDPRAASGTLADPATVCLFYNGLNGREADKKKKI